MKRFRIRSSYQAVALAPLDLVGQVATDHAGVRLWVVWLADLATAAASRMLLSVNAPRTTRSAGCSCSSPMASQYETLVALPPVVLMRKTLLYSRTSTRPLASALGITVVIGLALAPTWQPNRSQNPQ